MGRRERELTDAIEAMARRNDRLERALQEGRDPGSSDDWYGRLYWSERRILERACEIARQYAPGPQVIRPAPHDEEMEQFAHDVMKVLARLGRLRRHVTSVEERDQWIRDHQDPSLDDLQDEIKAQNRWLALWPFGGNA